MRTKRLILRVAAAATSVAFVIFAIVCWNRATLEAPPASFMLLDRHGAFLAQVEGSDATGYGYWPAPKSSERIVAALLALEDRRFWDHPGVDPIAVARAAFQDLAAGRRVSGASSIAMQVARLQHPEPRTLFNKAIEAGTAVALTLRYGRQAVLDHYLRIVPFGNNSHGVAHAARFYFDKPAADLSWAEIGLLAALPQAPSRMNPLTSEGRTRAVARGERMLEYLHDAGVIPDRDLALAQAQLRTIAIAQRPHRPLIAVHAILRLERLLGGADAWLASHQEARVEATLDLGIQARVEALAERRLPEWRAKGAQQFAAAVVDRRTREVLAWVGSSDYFAGSAGAIDFGGTQRSPGSTLKPFLYGMALDRGAVRADVSLRDDPDVAPGIENADRAYLGRLLPRQALANSRNAPAAGLVRTVGLDDTYRYLRWLGLHDSAAPAGHYGLGLAIGALPTSLERLVRAYGALADDGRLEDLAWYEGEDRAAPVRVMSADAARQVTLFLSDPMARLPSFHRMGPAEFQFPVAVKTGTSQDYRDAWTVAYSPEYIVGVWVGRADAGPMQGLSGVTSAAELAHDVMLALERRPGHALQDLSFPPPDAHRPIEVCGSDARRACGAYFREWVPMDARENIADRILIDRRTGALATQATPADDIVEAPLPERAPTRREAALRLADRGPKVVHLAVTAPDDHARLLRIPDAAPDADTIAFRAYVEGPFRSIEWYVDGRLYRTATTTETVRWPLQPGAHTLQIRLPGRPEGSAVTVFTVE